MSVLGRGVVSGGGPLPPQSMSLPPAGAAQLPVLLNVAAASFSREGPCAPLCLSFPSHGERACRGLVPAVSRLHSRSRHLLGTLSWRPRLRWPHLSPVVLRFLVHALKLTLSIGLAAGPSSRANTGTDSVSCRLARAVMSSYISSPL